MNAHYDYYNEAAERNQGTIGKLTDVMKVFEELSHSDIYSAVVMSRGLTFDIRKSTDKKTLEKMQAFIDKLKVQQDHSDD